MSVWLFLLLTALVVTGWSIHPGAALAASLAFAIIVAARSPSGLSVAGLAIELLLLASAGVAFARLVL